MCISGSRFREQRPLLPTGQTASQALDSLSRSRPQPRADVSEAAQSSSGCLCSFGGLQASCWTLVPGWVMSSGGSGPADALDAHVTGVLRVEAIFT